MIEAFRRRARASETTNSPLPTPLGIGSTLCALIALLGLGSSLGPFPLQPLTALTLSLISAGGGFAELRRAPTGTARRLVAGFALAFGLVAVTASCVVVIAFVPCGGRCLR
jgi:hypothetical protein